MYTLIVLEVARSAEILKFGTKLLRSSRFVTSCVWMVEALMALTAMGTF